MYPVADFAKEQRAVRCLVRVAGGGRWGVAQQGITHKSGGRGRAVGKQEQKTMKRASVGGAGACSAGEGARGCMPSPTSSPAPRPRCIIPLIRYEMCRRQPQWRRPVTSSQAGRLAGWLAHTHSTRVAGLSFSLWRSPARLVPAGLPVTRGEVVAAAALRPTVSATLLVCTAAEAGRGGVGWVVSLSIMEDSLRRGHAQSSTQPARAAN
jgi:hypothetical protein